MHDDGITMQADMQEGYMPTWEHERLPPAPYSIWQESEGAKDSEHLIR